MVMKSVMRVMVMWKRRTVRMSVMMLMISAMTVLMSVMIEMVMWKGRMMIMSEMVMMMCRGGDDVSDDSDVDVAV